MNKLSIFNKRTLRLTNVLQYQDITKGNDANPFVLINQMQSYIKAKGSNQIGPLIQHTRAEVSDDNYLSVSVTLMLQCTSNIQHVEPPYKMEPVIRIKDAMYCRYIGPEQYLKFAYDKIHLEA